MYELISACHPEIIQFLKANFCSIITFKEPNISPIRKLHKVLKCFQTIRFQRDAFSVQSHVLMRKNGNDDVIKDSPIACGGKTVFLIPIYLFTAQRYVCLEKGTVREALIIRGTDFNRPFARSGHMVRNKLCWDADYKVALSKLRKVGLDWYEFLCFGSPTALLRPSIIYSAPCDRIMQRT